MIDPLALRHAHDDARKQRVEAQLVFAEQLLELYPDQDSVWRDAIATARAAWQAGAADDTEAACAEAEMALAPIAAIAKQYTMSCCGHAHIDMNWMWGWHETVACTCDTVRTALKLMQEFPGLILAQSQASIYAILERHAPDLLDGVRAAIERGQWDVTASHWVEGERNYAGGEAICQQMMQTRPYLERLLGLGADDIPVDWSPDTFGHAATMPTIDAAGGVKYLYACRTGEQTMSLPPVYWWQGADGARVLVNRELSWYNGGATPDRSRFLIEFAKQSGMKEWLCVVGVGDHGGGPTRRDVRMILEMDSWPCFPNWRFTKVSDFFRRLEAEVGDRLEVYEGELNCEFTGCYTSQSRIKRGNRQAEQLCAETDTTTALASRLVGFTDRPELRRESWVKTCLGHFHDILPGSGIDDTRNYQLGLYQQVMADDGRLRQDALRAIADAVDTTWAGDAPAEVLPVALSTKAIGGGAGSLDTKRHTAWSNASLQGDGPRPFLIWNGSDHARREVVRIRIWDGDAVAPAPALEHRQYTVLLPDGTRVAPQLAGHGCSWDHGYVDLLTPLDLPALGWTSAAVIEAHCAKQTAEGLPAAVTGSRKGHGQSNANDPTQPFVLENGIIRATVDAGTARVISLVAIDSGRELLQGEGAGLLSTLERDKGMTSWVIGDTAPAPALELRKCWIDERDRGPWSTCLRAEYRVGSSRIDMRLSLAAGSRSLEWDCDLHWCEVGNKERGVPGLAFAADCVAQDGSCRYEIPHGSIVRPCNKGRVTPGVRWAAMGDERHHLALITQGQHGFSCADGGRLSVALIRSSFDPDPIPEVGGHHIRFRLHVGEGASDAAAISRLAADHENLLLAMPTLIHEGALPATLGLVSCDQEAVRIVGLSPSTDGSSIALRMVNEGPACTVGVHFAAALGQISTARRSDLLERVVADLPVDEHVVKVDAPAGGLISLLVTISV